LVGAITSDYTYKPDEIKDYPHIRKVEWQGRVSRDALSAASRNSLGSTLTLFLVNEDVWSDVSAVLTGKTTPTDEERVEEDKEELGIIREDVEAKARELIKDKILSLTDDELEQLAAAILRAMGYSRRLFVKAYFNERLDALLDGHAAAFSHFGGRTRTILYDNPRTIVLDKDESTGAVVWNPTFKDRMDFYSVELRLCRYYRAQTKGKVERGVKYVKHNALVGRTFRDLEHLNEWLLEWCLTIADQRLHGTTHERPADRFARGEATALLAVEQRQPPPRERLEQRIVPRDGLVVIDTNRYPVPLDWVGQQAAVRH